MARIVNEVPERPRKGGKKGTLPEHRKVQALAKENPGTWVMYDGTLSGPVIYGARKGTYEYQPSSDWEIEARRAPNGDNFTAQRFYMYVRYVGSQS